jgi:NAD(P)-dependent dehydrogenase (short-subunit alcohol dehydrogenase family)
MAGDPLDAFRLDGHRAWVTGASRGLGRAIAEGLIACGARVAVTARSRTDLEGLLDQTRSSDLVILAGSVADPDDVSSMGDAIGAAWGGVDILVNCAGISPSMVRSETQDLAEWQRIIDVNLTGAFLCAQSAARYMLPARHGSIINVSSVHAMSGMPRLAAYTATKGGMDALTRSLALEWADRGVRVNSLRPGYFKTDMSQGLRDHDAWNARLLDRIPMRRYGEPDEIVPPVLFLASSASRYVTGSCLDIDGGWSAD